MIEIHDLCVSLSQRPILSHFTLSVRPREVTYVLGRSGEGKSVLLKVLAGLLPFHQGTLAMGELRWHAGEHQPARLFTSDPFWAVLRNRCQLVLQAPLLLDSLTVAQNLVYGLYLRQKERRSLASFVDEYAEALAHSVGISPDILPFLPEQIAYSDKKKTAVGRALALRPEFLLFDEPTTGCDPSVSLKITRLIHEVHARHKLTTLVVSHDFSLAMAFADSLVFLQKGCVLLHDRAQAVRVSALPLVRAFCEASC